MKWQRALTVWAAVVLVVLGLSVAVSGSALGRGLGVTARAAAPAAATGRDSTLFEVSAVSASYAWAVGELNGRPLLVRWNGNKWIRSPAHTRAFLVSVAAIRPRDAWAVGSQGVPDSGQRVRPVIMHWDGSTWARVPSPAGGATQTLLKSVRAVSANDVWVVGDTDSGNGRRPLVLHYNGTRWTRMPTPMAPPGDDYYFDTLGAQSASNVWLSGSHDVGNSHAPLTAHWDGTHWSVEATPDPLDPSHSFNLTGITAISSTDAWAVGWINAGTRRLRTLALHWDGANWSRTPTPNLGSRQARLAGVDAISAHNVWAMGYYRPAGKPNRTLALHWTGNSWTAVRTPDAGYGGELGGPSAPTPTDAWAVGAFTTTKRAPILRHSLIVHWNGHRWSRTASP